MKFLRHISLGLCLTLGLAFAVAPAAADASGKNASSSKNRAVKQAKKASATARAAKAPSSVKSRAADRQGKSADNAKAKNAARMSDAEIWQERARRSKMMTGKASWYGKDFHGGLTASGVNYDMYTFTAAHRTLPMGTVVRVTDQGNDKSVMVCVTDRGPFIRGRIIDLSLAAAEKLDMRERGVGNVNLEVVSDANGTPLNPDQAFYIRYKSAARGKSENVGPFNAFSDAAAMHEALRQAHPEAEVVLRDSSSR